jgi:hypothetical protein
VTTKKIQSYAERWNGMFPGLVDVQQAMIDTPSTRFKRSPEDHLPDKG